MEAIREIKKSKGRTITIDLPERFSGMEMEVIVLPLSKKQGIKLDKLECLLLNESGLEDWNKVAEDQAWKSL